MVTDSIKTVIEVQKEETLTNLPRNQCHAWEADSYEQ